MTDAEKMRWRVSALGGVRKGKTAHPPRQAGCAVATAFAAVGTKILRPAAAGKLSRQAKGVAVALWATHRTLF
jgi:hypothetical protein